MEDSHSIVDPEMQQHPLSDEWCLWAHLPHDTDWSLNSYKPIYNYTNVEEVLAVGEALPDRLVKNCMLFIMRKGVTPLWEDPKNRSGGCFSYKVNNKIVDECWKKLTYGLVGESLSKNDKLQGRINGITISPKKSFCILKVWISDCTMQSSLLLNTSELKGLATQGCLFKKHLPSY